MSHANAGAGGGTFDEVEVVDEGVAAVSEAIKHLWARKLAIVTTTVLGRRQAMRVKEVRGDIELFEDRKAALAWLLA